MLKTNWMCEDDLLCGVNISKNRTHLADLEKQHIPHITAPVRVKRQDSFQVKIEVGKLMSHPNEPEHFIDWVELYAGDTFMGRVHYSGGGSFPQAVFKITMAHAEGPLKVWAKCNLHGLWSSTKEIKIL